MILCCCGRYTESTKGSEEDQFWVRPISLTLSWLKTVTFLETSFHAFPFAMVSLYPLHAMSQIHGNSRTASMTLSSMVAIFVTRCGSHVLS